MSYLSIDDILAAADLKEEPVDVPEWGGMVLVRELSAQQKIDIGMAANEGEMAELFVKAAAFGLGLKDPSKVEALGNKSFSALERVARTVMRLSEMDPGTPEKKT